MSTELPTFTDEKLLEYLGIWERLIERGYKSKLKIELTMDYGCFAWPLQRRYTLNYGEEKRELTYAQAFLVYDWLQRIARQQGGQP